MAALRAAGSGTLRLLGLAIVVVGCIALSKTILPRHPAQIPHLGSTHWAEHGPLTRLEG